MKSVESVLGPEESMVRKICERGRFESGMKVTELWMAKVVNQQWERMW